MRVVVAPDSFGGWRGAPAVALRIAGRLKAAGLTPVLLPQGDGGEGSAEALAPVALAAVALPATGPLGGRRGALCPVLPGPRLFVESAHALGPPNDETRASWASCSSRGLATLLLDAHRAARDHRAELVMGLGGSATVDGGLGLALGLGLRAEDAQGRPVRGGGAGALSLVRALKGAPPTVRPQVWADVRTPLRDAIRCYGAQKGVRTESEPALTRDLLHFADVLRRWSGRALPDALPGGGAAGGVGFALAALTGAELEPGAEAFAHVSRLRRALATCDAVVTGEGRLDDTSLEGKVVGTVTRLARAAGRPVVGVVGQDALPRPNEHAPDAVFAAGAQSETALDTAADAAATWLTCR
jgi:glycerate kinase